MPVHDELDLLKQSTWNTYSTLLHTDSRRDVDTLANLCLEAEIGFDNWSNATRFFQPNLHKNVSEYFDQAIFGKLERDVFLVAMAARRANDLTAVLRNWEVITLKKFETPEWLF
jgi:hypothetical protein